MKRIEIVVGGTQGAELLSADLVRTSIWFEVMPLPNDNYRIVSRDEPQVHRVFEGAKEFPPYGEPEDAHQGEGRDCLSKAPGEMCAYCRRVLGYDKEV